MLNAGQTRGGHQHRKPDQQPLPADPQPQQPREGYRKIQAVFLRKREKHAANYYIQKWSWAASLVAFLGCAEM